jgi:hypothetical protein
VIDHEKGQEKPECEIGIEMCRDKLQYIFQPIKLNTFYYYELKLVYNVLCKYFSPTDNSSCREAGEISPISEKKTDNSS